MTIKIRVALLAAGAVAMAAVLAPGSQALAQSLAQAHAAPVTDFSAQKEKKNKAAPKRGGAPRVAPQHVAPRAIAPRHMEPRAVAPRHVAPRAIAPKAVAPKFSGPKGGVPKGGVRKGGVPKVGGAKIGTPKAGGAPAAAPKVAAPKGAPRIFKPKGAHAGSVTAGKLRGVHRRGAGRASIQGRNFSVWRGGHRVRHHGRWRTLSALSLLGAILVGTNYYYPYAYIAAPEDYCQGLTEDGCELVWEEVETIEGDLVGQCVAYCPWQ